MAMLALFVLESFPAGARITQGKRTFFVRLVTV